MEDLEAPERRASYPPQNPPHKKQEVVFPFSELTSVENYIEKVSIASADVFPFLCHCSNLLNCREELLDTALPESRNDRWKKQKILFQ